MPTDPQQACERLGKLFSGLLTVQNVSWVFRDEKRTAEEVFSPNGCLALFVKFAEWESEFHSFSRSLDFSVVEDDRTLCGLAIVPKDGVTDPCYFGLLSSVREVVKRLLGNVPKDTAVLDDIISMKEEEVIPLSRFSWP